MSDRRPVPHDGPSEWLVRSVRCRDALSRWIREILAYESGAFGPGPPAVRLAGPLDKDEVCYYWGSVVAEGR